jgi:hypothetical protein
MERKTGFEPATLTLAKVFEFVHDVPASPPNWPSVYGESTQSVRIQPCCRAVYYEVATHQDRSVLAARCDADSGVRDLI